MKGSTLSHSSSKSPSPKEIARDLTEFLMPKLNSGASLARQLFVACEATECLLKREGSAHILHVKDAPSDREVVRDAFLIALGSDSDLLGSSIDTPPEAALLRKPVLRFILGQLASNPSIAHLARHVVAEAKAQSDPKPLDLSEAHNPYALIGALLTNGCAFPLLARTYTHDFVRPLDGEKAVAFEFLLSASKTKAQIEGNLSRLQSVIPSIKEDGERSGDLRSPQMTLLSLGLHALHHHTQSVFEAKGKGIINCYAERLASGSVESLITEPNQTLIQIATTILTGLFELKSAELKLAAFDSALFPSHGAGKRHADLTREALRLEYFAESPSTRIQKEAIRNGSKQAITAAMRRDKPLLISSFLGLASAAPELISKEIYRSHPDLVLFANAFPTGWPVIAAVTGLISRESAENEIIGLQAEAKAQFSNLFQHELASLEAAANHSSLNYPFKNVVPEIKSKGLAFLHSLNLGDGIRSIESLEPKPKPIILTGSGSGIGASLSAKLCEKALKDPSIRVFLTARDRSLSRSSEFVKRTPRVFFRPLDVTNPVERNRLVSEIEYRFGAVWGIINNAGTSFRSVVEHADPDERRLQHATNVDGPIDLISRALPKMREARAGRLLNVSSVGGMMAMPTMGYYSASKFALEALSESLYYELRPYNISITLIQPGFVRSDGFENVVWARRAHRSVILGNEYAPYYANMSRFVAACMRRATATPDSIAKDIMKVLDSKSPPLRKCVSIDGVLFGLMRRVMPARIYHEILYQMLPRRSEWEKGCFMSHLHEHH